jgi:hypothetical protein
VTSARGTATLYLGGEEAGEGRVDATKALVFSADEITGVGYDSATPVSDDHGPTEPPSRDRSAGWRLTSARRSRTPST